MNKNTAAYVAQEVESADPAHLVELLFQRAVRDLEAAGEMWPALPRSVEAIRLAVHAQAIMGELHSCLNYAEGGELALNLGRLYEYMQYRISQAVTSCKPEDAETIAEVARLLGSLSSAWSEMARGRGTEGEVMVSYLQGEALTALSFAGRA